MFKIALSTVALLLSCNLLALTVYEQPAEHTKTAFIAKPGQKLIPIIRKDTWLKVANPLDGEVGWVPIAELQGHIPTVKGTTAEQRIITTHANKNTKPKVVSIVEYSDSLSPEQAKQLANEIEQRRMQMERNFQLMFNQMLDSFRLFEPFNWDAEWHSSHWVVVPLEAKPSSEPEQIKKPWLAKLKDKFK